MTDPTQPNPNREVESRLQRTLIDHVPQLEEEIEEVFNQLDEARQNLTEAVLARDKALIAMKHEQFERLTERDNLQHDRAMIHQDWKTEKERADQLQSERDALKAEVERVRKTWAANWQEQKDQVERLTRDLAECFVWAGSESSGQGIEVDASRAVAAVKELRKDYDEDPGEMTRLKDQVEELRAALQFMLEHRELQLRMAGVTRKAEDVERAKAALAKGEAG